MAKEHEAKLNKKGPRQAGRFEKQVDGRNLTGTCLLKKDFRQQSPFVVVGLVEVGCKGSRRELIEKQRMSLVNLEHKQAELRFSVLEC